ncbi:MAG: molecular chaperone [Pseudomonadota bacterium]
MAKQSTFRAAVQTAAFFIAASFAPAFAGSFQVTPVRVDLSAQQKTAAVTVTNNGERPVVIQLQSAAWTQENGLDKYGPTEDLIATPPIFTVQAGAKQVVRIGLRVRPDASKELSYRIYMQEVPPPPTPGFRGLQVALRIGIPVFVEPATKAAGSLTFAAKKSGGGQLAVTLSNTGKAHLKVTDFHVSVPGIEGPIASEQVTSYLLPLQARVWSLPLDPKKPLAGPTVHVKAFTDAGPMEADVTLDKP